MSGVIVKNTVEMDFGRVFPKINMIEIHKFIRKLFRDINMSEQVIYGIMGVIQSQNQVIRMKFFDDREGEFKKFLEKYSGVGNMKFGRMNLKVKVYDATLSMKFVRIGDAPFEMSIIDITRALKPYGAIMDIRRDRYTGTDYVAGFQGWITVKMVVSADIPSYLQVGGHKLIIKYDGQKVTCRHCLKSGHIVRECPELNSDLYDEETDPGRARELKEIEAKKRKEDEEMKRKAREEASKESGGKNDEEEQQPIDSALADEQETEVGKDDEEEQQPIASPLADEQETEVGKNDEAKPENSSAEPAASEENDENDGNEEMEKYEELIDVVTIDETPDLPIDDEDEDKEEGECESEDEGMEGVQNTFGSPGRTPKRSYSDVTRSSTSSASLTGSESESDEEKLMPPTPAAGASGNSSGKISQVKSPENDDSRFKNVKFTEAKGKKVKK